MTGYELRVHLKGKLLRDESAAMSSVVVEELGMRHGKGRIDLALLNGLFNGFEIKSHRDSLARLEGQIAVYSTVMDTITLVLAAKHAERGLRMVPGWWGLMVARPVDGSNVRFDVVREAQLNTHVDHVSQARLLWRQEVLTILLGLGEPRSVARKPRRELYEMLASLLDPVQLRSTVRVCLKSRTGWRST